MASLDLKLDTGECPSEVREPAWTKPMESPKSIAGWIKSIGRKQKTAGLGQVAGTTDFTRAKIANIICNFLQPDSSMSLIEAANSILLLIPANAPQCHEVKVFAEFCVDLGEQIPYNHPSQRKLACLIQRLDKSDKFLNKSPSPDGAQIFVKHLLLRQCIRENVHFPEEEDPSVYVNFQSFIANLWATGIFGVDEGWSVQTMRDAFEDDEVRKPWETESYYMAAAQWIIFYGQNLFQQILYQGERGSSEETTNYWRLGEKQLLEKMEPRSLERWRFLEDLL